MAKNDKAVAPATSTAVAVPEFLKQYVGAGLETMTREDLALPRLAIAQGLSPQLQRAEPSYIADLKSGDMFNTITSQVYGEGPLEFAVIRRDAPRYVEFFPRNDGGGVKDLNVPANDPRTQFTNGPDGQRVKPLATKFYDYIIVMLPSRELIALSLKSTSLKRAKELNTFITMRPEKVLFLGKYTVRSVQTKNALGTFGTYKFDNAGNVEDLDTLKFLAAQFEAVRDKNLVVEREPGDDVPDEM